MIDNLIGCCCLRPNAFQIEDDNDDEDLRDFIELDKSSGFRPQSSGAWPLVLLGLKNKNRLKRL